MKERMKRWLAVAVPLLMGLSLFTAVAYGAYFLTLTFSDATFVTY